MLLKVGIQFVRPLILSFRAGKIIFKLEQCQPRDNRRRKLTVSATMKCPYAALVRQSAGRCGLDPTPVHLYKRLQLLPLSSRVPASSRPVPSRSRPHGSWQSSAPDWCWCSLMWHAHPARVFTGGTPVPLSQTAPVPA